MARRFLLATLPAFMTLAVLGACTELKVADSAATDGGGDTPAAEGGAEGADGGKDGSAAKDAQAVDSGKKDSGPPPPSCDGPCPPEELASGIGKPTALAVDATNIYFAVENGTGTVYQCPKTGCKGAPIVLGAGAATGIAVVGGKVYWGDFAAGKVQSCAVGGCSQFPTTVVSDQTYIHGVFTDGTRLFWETGYGTIRYCPAATCSGATAKDIATEQGYSAFSIAAEQGTVIWPGPDKGVYACALGSCPSPTRLGPGIVDVTIHAGEAFWVTQAKNIVRCPLSGCAESPVTLGSSNTPRTPVSDGAHVYWRDGSPAGKLYRCPLSGCTPGLEVLAIDQNFPEQSQIALDSEYVYWTASSGVFRLRK